METKTHLFCETEESIDVSDKTSGSCTTNLSSRNVESKKVIQFSKTTGKKYLPETSGLSPERKKIYETSIFLHKEVKLSEFSGTKKVKRKKSLQVQIHHKRTESICTQKLSKEKMPGKESSSHKLPSQSGPQKTSSSFRPSISVPRKKEENLPNLYLTLYEVPEGYLQPQELIGALPKACKIFSKVRSGKIYVNDLPVVLHTLKISMSDTEMRKVLKTVDIDVNGMLDFSDFLKAGNDVSHLASKDPAFQNALKIFNRIKGGRVSSDEVVAVLDSMGIVVNPETLQDVKRYTHVDSNHMVDIGDIIFKLDELQQQYEDVAVMSSSAMDEATSSRKLSNISGYALHHKKKGSLLSKFAESLASKKSTVSSTQYSKTMEKNIDLEFKRSKSFLQIRKSSSRLASSYMGSQEPYSKSSISVKKSPEKAEIHDTKFKTHSLKSTTSLNKFLDKSDSSNISKLQKPVVRKHSTILKPVLSKEKPEINILENAYETINKLQENYISPEELKSTLPSLGIHLLDDELQRIVAETAKNENGMVNLDDFIKSLSKEQNFPEYDVLTDVIKGIDILQEENVDYENLNTCLQNFGVYLSKPDLKKIKELNEVDETKKVNLKKFIDTMMSHTEHFSEKLQLPAAIENLETLTKEKMEVSELWKTMTTLNSNLKKDEFLDAIKLVAVDENGEVQFEEFAEAVKNVHDTSKLEELQEIALALDSLEGDKINKQNLESFLRNVGIKPPKDDIEKIFQSDIVSEDNMVNIKDCVKALRDTEKFSNFVALNEAINTLDSMKESYQFDKDKYSDDLENIDKTYYTDAALQKIIKEEFKEEALSSKLKLPLVNEIKEAADILSHVDNGKIAIPDVEHALKCLNINFTEEDFNEALKCCDIGDNMEVDLKDFLTEMKKTPNYEESSVVQLLLATSQILQNDLIDVADLKKLLMNEGLHTANAVLTTVLKNVPENEDGKVTIQDFMSKFSDTLATIKAEGDKEQFYNTNIKKSDLKTISDIQKKLNTIGVHLTNNEIQKVLNNTNPGDEVIHFKDFVRELINTDEFNECQRKYEI